MKNSTLCSPRDQNDLISSLHHHTYTAPLPQFQGAVSIRTTWGCVLGKAWLFSLKQLPQLY